MSNDKEVTLDEQIDAVACAKLGHDFDSELRIALEAAQETLKKLEAENKIIKVSPVEAEQGEKPDFEKLMDDINYDDNSSPGGFGEECMEKVWNTYVVPLQAELSAVKILQKDEELAHKLEMQSFQIERDLEVSRLTKELEQSKSISKQFETQSSERGYQIQSLEKERDELKVKLEDSEKVRLAQVQDLTALKSQLNVMENERNIALARLI